MLGLVFRAYLHHRVRSEERHGGVLPVLHLTVARFGIRVYDLGVRVSGLGLRVWGLGFGFKGVGSTSFRTARNSNVMAGIAATDMHAGTQMNHALPHTTVQPLFRSFISRHL